MQVKIMSTFHSSPGKNSYSEFDINFLKHFTSNAKELDTAEQLTNTHSHICFKNTAH